MPGGTLRFLLYLLIAASLYLPAAVAFGEAVEKKLTPPIDIIGIGGAGVTSYDDFGMLFMNPAAFALYDDLMLSLIRAGISANLDLYNYYDIYNTLSKNGSDFSKLSSGQWKNLINSKAEIGATGPLALGFLWQGIGFLVYDQMLVSEVTKQDPGLPYVDFGSYMDIGCIAGFGFKIPVPVFLGKFTEIYGGVSVKYINRIKYENPRLSLIEAYDLGISLFDFKKGYLWGQAIGSDAGLLLKNEDLALGLVLRDWFGTQFSWREYSYNFQEINSTNNTAPTYWPTQLDVGSSYRFKTIFPSYFISDLILYFDLDNILDFKEDFFLKTRFGAEISIFKFIKLRGGFYKGYPTAGVGLVFPGFSINTAYYTEELGELPGTIPQQNFLLEFDLTM